MLEGLLEAGDNFACQFRGQEAGAVDFDDHFEIVGQVLVRHFQLPAQPLDMIPLAYAAGRRVLVRQPPFQLFDDPSPAPRADFPQGFSARQIAHQILGAGLADQLRRQAKGLATEFCGIIEPHRRPQIRVSMVRRSSSMNTRIQFGSGRS